MMVDMQEVMCPVMYRYGRAEFWDDLKKLYHMCGVEEREVAFLLTDSQIAQEVFLEDVSSILNSGEVPGILSTGSQWQLA